VSYQTEERIWTDYVRVATPIVGLLLLLGVFWYWANSLIGADSQEAPPTTAASVTVIPAPTSTPTPTEEAAPTSEAVEPTATTEQQAAEPSPTQEEAPKPTRTPRTETEQPTEEPTAEPEPGSYAEGQVIYSADDDVNMRASPSTSAEVLEVLSLDQPLTVVSGEPREGDGIVWWNVRNEDSGNEGWVSEQWLKAET